MNFTKEVKCSSTMVWHEETKYSIQRRVLLGSGKDMRDSKEVDLTLISCGDMGVGSWGLQQEDNERTLQEGKGH